MMLFLLAPPFGSRNSYKYADKGLKRTGIIDDTSYYLNLGLRLLKEKGKLIAVIPDGFLSSNALKKAREYFYDNNKIEAIISLPYKTFIPFTAVKTSLIVIRKGKDNGERACFMGSLESFENKNELDISEYRDAIELVNNIKDFRKNKFTGFSKLGFINKNLTVENFHFSKYWFESYYGNVDNLPNGFFPFSLKELLNNINRGSNLKIEDGSIEFIGPAAIRRMQLIEDEFCFTSKEALPRNVKRVEENDILINAIGPYRGNATIVPKGFENIPINRHVILLKVNQDLILPGYLAIALNSKYVRDQFFDNSSGTVIPSLNLKILEEVYIPVPNKEKQKEIYEDYLQLFNRLSEIEKSASSIKSTIDQKLSSFGKEVDSK